MAGPHNCDQSMEARAQANREASRGQEFGGRFVEARLCGGGVPSSHPSPVMFFFLSLLLARIHVFQFCFPFFPNTGRRTDDRRRPSRKQNTRHNGTAEPPLPSPCDRRRRDSWHAELLREVLFGAAGRSHERLLCPLHTGPRLDLWHRHARTQIGDSLPPRPRSATMSAPDSTNQEGRFTFTRATRLSWINTSMRRD